MTKVLSSSFDSFASSKPSGTKSNDGAKLDFDPIVKSATWSPQILIAKRSSVELGYYDDEYIKYFSPKVLQNPIFNMYIYARVVGIRKIIERFFECFGDGKVQFVNLGCGLDTTSLWVLKRFPNAVCFDSDLEFQTKLKTDIFKNSPDLLSLFPRYETTESSFHSDRYHIFPIDLRFVDQLDKLKQFGFSDQLPTIFLSEFVLTFIENDLSNLVIERLHNLSKRPSILVYHEWITPTGRYASWFLDTVKDGSPPFYSAYEYPTPESHVKRHKDLGWDDVFARRLAFVYNYIIDKKERARLRKIENFNEMDCLGICLSQYLTAVAFKNTRHLEYFNQFFQYPMLENGKHEGLVHECNEEELKGDFDLQPFINCFMDWFNVARNAQH